MNRDEGRAFQALLTEYQECNAGYAYRDVLIPQQFTRIAAGFYFLGILLVGFTKIVVSAFSDDQTMRWGITVAGNLYIGVSAFFYLYSAHSDLVATASTKAALRRQATDLESKLGIDWKMPIGMWKKVETRPRLRGERLLREGIVWRVLKWMFILTNPVLLLVKLMSLKGGENSDSEEILLASHWLVLTWGVLLSVWVLLLIFNHELIVQLLTRSGT